MIRRTHRNPAAPMTLVGHLEEFRGRLFFCVVAVVIGASVAFLFYGPILQFLLTPLPVKANALIANGGKLKIAVTGIGEGFGVVLKLSIAVGVALATPVWMYHLWGFIAPALTPREKRRALPFALTGVVLFLAGLAVGFVTLRYPINWLLGFGDLAVTFFVAELGDKTMLMTVTIASQQHSFAAVWLGSTLGMVVADGLAIIVGKVVGARLPETLIRFGAAGIFVITGVATLVAAATHL